MNDNTFIYSIIKSYVEKPIHLWIPVIITLLIMMVSYPLFLLWTLNEIIVFCLLWFGVVFMVAGKYLTLRDKIIIEEEYDKALEKPFEQKFIVRNPNNKIELEDEIDIPANKTQTIVFRTNTALDLEIRDSQYNFGGDGNKKKPEIIRYKNPFYKGKTSLTKWFDKDLGEDWWGLYHLSGKRLMFTDKTYTDGFEIRTHDKGRFMFDLNFLILCKKYKNLEKEKSKHIRTSLKVNVI